MPSKKAIATKPDAADKKEKVFNLRLPCTPDNDVAGILERLAKADNRSLNNMVIELIKRADKK